MQKKKYLTTPLRLFTDFTGESLTDKRQEHNGTPNYGTFASKWNPPYRFQENELNQFSSISIALMTLPANLMFHRFSSVLIDFSISHKAFSM